MRLARSLLADVVICGILLSVLGLRSSGRAATEHGPQGPRAVSWFRQDGSVSHHSEMAFAPQAAP